MPLRADTTCDTGCVLTKRREDRFCGQRILEKLIEYLRRSLSVAYKSIFFNFKQYIYFFVALLIVQMFYGIMTISSYNNSVVETQSAVTEYNYDIMLTHLTDSQYATVKTYGESSTGNHAYDGAKYYNIIDGGVEEYKDGARTYYDVRIVFKGDSDAGLARFKEEYYNSVDMKGLLLEDPTATGNTVFFYESPRMQIDTNIAVGKAGYWTISAILLVLSIFLMTSLYNIRVNQYKFTYGVYMTFGADFKKLFSTAFWEMFMISCITFIPSVIFSTAVVYLIYLPSGFPFTFNPLVFLQVFIFSLIVVLFAVFFPMRIMATRNPMSLIVTQDNSNLVTSPRYSINVFKQRFPTKYELYSAWRFRKHSISLLGTAIVFCAFFIMGLYLADIYTTDLEYKRPDYLIDLTEAYAYDEGMGDELYAIDGIEAVQVSDNFLRAKDVDSHILVNKSHVKLFSSAVTGYKGNDFKEDVSVKASNSVLYNAVTEEQLKVLESFYSYEGDLYSVINNDNTIIIGDSVSNIKTYSYEVGDVIWVAKCIDTAKVDSHLSGNRLLAKQMERFSFEYEAYTIGAILTDIPSGDLPVFFSGEDYENITGKAPKSFGLNIYIDQSLTLEERDALDASLREWGQSCGNVSVENTYRIQRNNVSYDKHTGELYICISIMLLIISPIMWFFSQGLYYMKRESEFNILQALGAMVKEIRQIYIQGGLIMSGLSLVVSIALSFLGSYALFYVYNVAMPYFSGENVRYTFYMPWYALLISVVVSVACGFLSSYLPFRSYIKNRATLENGGAGASED